MAPALAAVSNRSGLPACGRQDDRRDNIAAVPTAHSPEGGVDVAEALHAGWLELWYQPKVGSRALELRGAEALIRMRHPQWGIVQPAYFMSTAHDWCSCELSQFVVHRALADWRYFVSEQRRLDLSIILPISFLEDPASIDYLRRQLPDHPAFNGLIIEIDGGDITRDLSVARKFANDSVLVLIQGFLFAKPMGVRSLVRTTRAT